MGSSIMNRASLGISCFFLFGAVHPGEAARNCPNGWVDGTYVGMGCFLFNASQKYILDDAQSYCQGVENATLEWGVSCSTPLKSTSWTTRSPTAKGWRTPR